MPAELSKSPEEKLRPPLQSSATTPNDPIVSQLRGFGPLGLIAILAILLTGNVAVGRAGGAPVFLPVGASLVMVWRWMSRTAWRELGYVSPKSWIGSLTVGILFGVTFKFLMKAIVMPILGAPPINQAFHFLAGNHAALPVALWSMIIIVAGWGEETLFRRLHIRAFRRKLLGSKIEAKIVIVLVSSLWFGWDHYSSQGLAGVEQAIIAGLVYGTIFMITGRLFMVMCAHAAFDLAALAIIYWDLESRVAHLVFR
jgi:membrane protease YdiL (CAAX protease family)